MSFFSKWYIFSGAGCDDHGVLVELLIEREVGRYLKLPGFIVRT